MTALRAFLHLTFYATPTVYARSGIGGTDLTTSFSEACDYYAEQMEQGRDCAVVEVNVVDGTSKDVTAAARDEVARRLTQRGADLPAWMEAA